MSIRFVPEDFHFDFCKWKMCSIFFSTLLIVLSFLVVTVKGINWGVDFTGGLVVEFRAEEEFKVAELQKVLEIAGVQGITVQLLDNSRDVVLRTKNAGEDQRTAVEQLKGILHDRFGEVTYRKIDYVGPHVGSKQVLEGLLAIILSLLGMFLYLWLRFNWKFGFGGVLALIHDTVITVGFISLLSIEFNLSSTAAILTVIGYSVNDSVVIFDRIREFLRKARSIKVSEIVNTSISSTLSRTVLTSATTILATLPLIIFCTGTVHDFSLIIFFGIIIGTYSSIFIAPAVLLGVSEKVDPQPFKKFLR